MPAPASAASPHIVFYDGDCGLCHAFVRFLLYRDIERRQFLFSPLRGRLITQHFSEAGRAALPDSVVLLSPDGRVRTRSDAALSSLELLGGFWRTVALISRLLPASLRDAVYSLVARVRRSIFGTTAYACPLVPAELRDRFAD